MKNYALRQNYLNNKIIEIRFTFHQLMQFTVYKMK